MSYSTSSYLYVIVVFVSTDPTDGVYYLYTINLKVFVFRRMDPPELPGGSPGPPEAPRHGPGPPDLCGPAGLPMFGPPFSSHFLRYFYQEIIFS